MSAAALLALILSDEERPEAGAILALQGLLAKTSDPIPAPTGNSYYVDSAVGSSGDGESWATAWKTLADIQWASVLSNSTIYLSGGADGGSKTYSGALTIAKDVGPNSPIVLRRGTTAGHTGTPVLDGGGSQATGITFTSAARNVTVDGLEIKGYTAQAISVGSGASFIRINNCSIQMNNTAGTNRGVRFNGTADCALTNCAISEAGNSDSVGELLRSENNTRLIVSGNTVTPVNTSNSSGGSAFRSYNDYSVLCAGNTFTTLAASGAASKKILLIESVRPRGCVFFCNNVFKGLNSHINSILTAPPALGGLTIAAFNTFFEGAPNVALSGSVRHNLLFINNIVANVLWHRLVSLTPAYAPPSSIVGNLFHSSTGQFTVSGVDKTYAEFVALGYNGGGALADPKFVDAGAGNFQIQVDSPARGRALPVQPSVPVDRKGLSRLGAIGAYEYEPPPPQFSNIYAFFDEEDVPAGAPEDDVAVNLGMRFSTASAVEISGVAVYCPAGQNITATLYTTDEDVLATAGGAVTETGWNDFFFEEPVEIEAGDYVAGAWFADGAYYYAGGVFTEGLSANGLTAPDTNGVFGYAAVPAIPWNVSPGKASYYVQPILRIQV